MRIAESTTSTVPRRSVVLRLALALAFVLSTTVAAGVAQAATFSETKQVTVQYRAGSAAQNGYESASIDVSYRFADCGRNVQLHHRVKPDTLRHQHLYWYQGTRYALPETFPGERRTSVLFQGRTAGPGGTYDFSAPSESSGQGQSCMGSDLKVALSESLFDRKATESQKQFRLNGMTVATAAAGFYAPPLESASAERYIRERLIAGKSSRETETHQAPPPISPVPRVAVTTYAPASVPVRRDATPTAPRPRPVASPPVVAAARAPVTKTKVMRRPQDCSGKPTPRIAVPAAYYR